jgi:hypothetical protein
MALAMWCVGVGCTLCAAVRLENLAHVAAPQMHGLHALVIAGVALTFSYMYLRLLLLLLRQISSASAHMPACLPT